jgi:DNA-binding NtrC family response regulator
VITASDCVGISETIAWYKPDLIILSIKEDAEKELDTLEDIRNAHHDMPVILSTEYLPLKTIQSLLWQIERSHEAWLNEMD